MDVLQTEYSCPVVVSPVGPSTRRVSMFGLIIEYGLRRENRLFVSCLEPVTGLPRRLARTTAGDRPHHSGTDLSPATLRSTKSVASSHVIVLRQMRGYR